MRRALAAAGAALLLLTGCSADGSPEAELQAGVNDLVSAANERDPAAVRTAGGRLLQTISAQSANGDISTTKAQTLRVLTSRIMANAGQLQEAETPAPAPSTQAPVTERPTPTPTPTPEQPSPSPTPTTVRSSPSASSVVLPSLQASPQPS